MEYPHKRFLHFLISKRLERFEIMAECASLQLLPPNDSDLMALFRNVGLPHSDWVPDFKKANLRFKQWLQDVGVYELWEQDPDVADAFGFLNQGAMRDKFESLVLLHVDVEIAREDLKNIYPTRRIPSLLSLELYCHFFWDVFEMSKPGLFDFLKLQENKEFKVAALDGDVDLIQAILGVRQKPNFLDNIDLFLQLVKVETISLLRAGGTGSGQRSAGHAALFKTAMDAMGVRVELAQDTVESDMRKEASLFAARIVHRTPAKAIPSIDDLYNDGDVVDAEYSEPEEEVEGGGAIIHRLPVGRGAGKA